MIAFLAGGALVALVLGAPELAIFLALSAIVVGIAEADDPARRRAREARRRNLR